MRNAEVTLQQTPEAARRLGKSLVVAKAANDAELEPAFAMVVQKGAGALMVDADPFFYSQRTRVVALAEHYRLPAIYEFRDFVASGGFARCNRPLSPSRCVHRARLERRTPSRAASHAASEVSVCDQSKNRKVTWRHLATHVDCPR